MHVVRFSETVFRSENIFPFMPMSLLIDRALRLRRVSPQNVIRCAFHLLRIPCIRSRLRTWQMESLNFGCWVG